MTRTINKILWDEYLSKIEIEVLKSNWIINWCWWKDWFNFDSVMDNIKSFKWFKRKKLQQLKEDIKQLCYIHDLDFHWQKWFYKSNFKFAYRLAKLLTFTWFFERFMIFIITFWLLNKYWKEYYNKID